MLELEFELELETELTLDSTGVGIGDASLMSEISPLLYDIIYYAI